MSTTKRVVMLLVVAAVFVACDQKPNPRVDWPPMPGWEHAPDAAPEAGATRSP